MFLVTNENMGLCLFMFAFCQIRERIGDPIVIEGDGTVNEDLVTKRDKNNLDSVNILKRKAADEHSTSTKTSSASSKTTPSRSEGVSPFKKPLTVST